MPEQDSAQKKNIKLSIMQREYTVACNEDESDGLIEAAAYLDKQMRQISEGNQVLGMDRCAVMAGLNISYSYLQMQKNADAQDEINDRLEKTPLPGRQSGFQFSGLLSQHPHLRNPFSHRKRTSGDRI